LDINASRMTTIGSERRGLDQQSAQRLASALSADYDELFNFVQDPSPELLKAFLKNPSLAEPHLLALLKRRDIPEDLIRTVCLSSIARESHRVKVAIANHAATPAAQLSEILPHLHMFELAALCSRPGVTPDQKAAAERAIIQRLPAAPLGSRMTLARSGTSAVVEHLIKEGDSRLISACLDNPRLKEGSVFQFLRGATTSAESISAIARHPRWQNRPNIRQAILSNPKTPMVWFASWLQSMHNAELRRLFESQRLGQMQRKEVLAELARRGERMH
jgi:hypothetical protein